MLGNALKISLRTLHREKRYAVINIAGLALAIACVVILALYLRSELTYDQHYEGHENIYRVVNEFNINGTISNFAVTSQMLAPMMTLENPDIEQSVRFRSVSPEMLMRYNNLSLFWKDTYFVSPNVFDVFKEQIISGDPKTALVEPYTIAISESVAHAYFGNDNPIGENLVTDGDKSYRVTLVFADQPENTHLKYTILFSYDNPTNKDPTDISQQRQRLFGVNHFTYMKMRPGYNLENWAASSQRFFDNNMQERGKAIGMSWRSWLQPLVDIHLHSDVTADLPTGNLYYLYAFTAVAVFILLVACINYMNLATARSAKRAREVGMRKILGSTRKALITQFLTESILYSLIALVFGLVLVELTFTFTSINDLLNKPLGLTLTKEPQLLFIVTLGSVVVGLLAGLYPALYLSSWQPLTALVGNRNSGKTSATFRSVLVFIQFTISIAVIACSLLMAQQMKYVANKSLGFEKENKLLVPLRGFSVLQQTDVIKTELLKNPNVLKIATTGQMLGGSLPLNSMPVESLTGTMETTGFYNMVVGSDFIEVMKLELAQGRSFGQRLLTDVGTNFVVNQAFVNMMGWGEQALGKKIANGKVIGVVKDFHFSSLHNAITPFMMRTFPDDYLENVDEINKPYMRQDLVVSISGNDIRGTLSFLEEKINGFDPRHPFEYTFFDESLNKLYQSEDRLMKLIGIFAGICIFISCLGLFGLAAFTTEQRTREIGVRKVLGASAGQIIALLSRNILGLVFAGAIVASLLSWLAIDKWLTGFAYRADINPLAFVVATLAAMIIAYATVALQSYKTAQADPSRSLHFE